MLIDIPNGETWLELSEKYRRLMPFQDERLQVQIYAGFQHALYEATQGLAQLFSYKKTIAILGERIEPAIEQIAVDFSEESYEVVRLHTDGPESLDAQIAKIQIDLIFVLAVEDDPVTGRLTDLQALGALLTAKKIFLVSLSHAHHRLGPLARPGLYDVRVISLSSERALLLGGERFKLNPLVARRLPWHPKVNEDELKVPSPAEKDDWRQRILAFEARLPDGFETYFETEEARSFDRAVIVHPGHDGSAMIDLLLKLYPARSAKNFATSSPCAWNLPRFLDWMLKKEAETTVRGLIVIDVQEIDAALAGQLAQASLELTALEG